MLATSMEEEQQGVAVLLEEAAVCESLGEYRDAVKLYEKALKLQEESGSQDDAEVACTLNELGGNYRWLGRFDAAERSYQKSLAILERTEEPSSPDVANVLNNLSGLAISSGRYDRAEEDLARSRRIIEELLGLDADGSPHDLSQVNVAPSGEDVPAAIKIIYLNSLCNLGNLFRVKGEYAKAAPPLHCALVTSESVFGQNHPAVANALNNLGMLYKYQAKYGEAETVYQRARHILVGLRRWEEAECLYRRSNRILLDTFGEKHRDVAMNYNELAAISHAQRR